MACGASGEFFAARPAIHSASPHLYDGAPQTTAAVAGGVSQKKASGSHFSRTAPVSVVIAYL